MKTCKPEYLAKVQLLSEEESERLFSRMTGKLQHRRESDKINKQEALAIQLEFEDKQLQEWRKMMEKLKEDVAMNKKSKTKNK
jgi:N-acyl-L-homoserine lactone synthetase